VNVQSIAVSDINVGTRRREDFGNIEALAASIAKYGLFHPLIVDDKNNLVAGERRLVACTSLGWTEIDCRPYSDLTEDERHEIELEENLQRKDLTPFEVSKNLVRLTQVAEKIIQSEFPSKSDEKSDTPKIGRPEKAISEEKVAERVGIPRSTVHNAKAHVKAVETYPELKDAPQKQAIETAKTLNSLPEKKRETVRSNISSIKKAPLPKPSKRSQLSPIQEVIYQIKTKGGAVSFSAGMTQQEQFNFRDDLASCRDELERFVNELTDFFDDLRETA
jgi:ParB-like chromosome segregation protein Spo0J